MRRVIVVTGEVDSGKTTLANSVCSRLDSDGYRMGGVLQAVPIPGMAKDDRYVADIASGAVKLLMTTREMPLWRHRGRFWIDDEAFTWCNDRILAAHPYCDIIALDEIGPIELEQGGLAPALRHLAAQGDATILMVVRRSLLTAVCDRFGIELSSAFLMDCCVPLETRYPSLIRWLT